jgi:predicted glutamine amidotransferase
MIHCRLATHGSICEANCHPFERDGVFFAHNGILNIEPIGDKTDSETAFVKYIYPVVKRYGLQSDETKNLVSSLIGSSKFCIFDTDNMTIRLFGAYEKMGGVYYSNTRFLYYIRQSKRACHNYVI